MPFSKDFITLTDVCQAYRKAKFEAFKDTNCAHGQKFAEFESRLEFNLELLLRRLTAPKTIWFQDPNYIGRATCIAKSITPAEASGTHFRLIEPFADWNRLHRSQKAKAEFRPVIDPTVPFQVISALWLLKAGYKYDGCLDTRFAVGNRLRRWRAPKSLPIGSVGKINEKSHALFRPYHIAFGKWREDGLNTMRRELDAGREIVAITMDLQRFYHQVDPSFLLQRSYLEATGITLDADQSLFTQQLISAIGIWNRRAKKLTGSAQFGLPVGLTASCVIANVLLKEFDDGILSLEPCYYGRYVDDVFLVLRRGHFDDADALMKWLAGRLGKSASFYVAEGSPVLELKYSYSAKSKLLFVGKKQKVFQLKGAHGLDLINPIEEQIRRQKSEHRGVSELPDREAEMAARALLVSSNATLDADALRKADAVTLKRAGFAMLLSSVEQHAHHVESKSWRTVRFQFYGLAERHLLTPVGFFDFQRYIPRILGVMVTCRDRMRALAYVRQISHLMKLITRTTDFRLEEFSACKRALAERLIEAALQAPTVERGTLDVLFLVEAIREKLAPLLPKIRRKSIIQFNAMRLFLADWSRRSYGITWLEARLAINGNQTRPRNRTIRSWVEFPALQQFQRAAGIKEPFHWPALAFPTRRIPVSDLTCHAPGLLRNYSALASAVSVLRGTWTAESSRLRVTGDGAKSLKRLTIPNRIRSPLHVTVTNFKTANHEWKAAVKSAPVLTLERYRRVNSLVNQVLGQMPRTAYLLMPECSLPRRWARTIAYKLALKGIGLIAGLEYAVGKGGVHNDALVSLPTTFPGYSTSVAILQPKLAPAWGEKKEIEKISGASLASPSAEAFTMPIYVHGRFCFAVLICSDLTTLSNRSAIQGHIDCLFVPEWNQDLETFVSLVESTTNDLHAYVVQANNRLYGDSRIRAPLKEGFKRDVVRIRGGLHDYFVTDKIDVEGLREFQGNETPPTGDDARFKPFPVGYKRSSTRGGT